MFALRLFQSRQRKCYAQLDHRGHCVALWELHQPPAEGNWVCVTELNSRWIGSALPSHALLPNQPRASAGRWRLQQA
ncbi:MAG: hypothetical protein V7693_15045 [Halopseudomonas sabulinigri]|jgi:hypothetical protein